MRSATLFKRRYIGDTASFKDFFDVRVMNKKNISKDGFHKSVCVVEVSLSSK